MSDSKATVVKGKAKPRGKFPHVKRGVTFYTFLVRAHAFQTTHLSALKLMQWVR